MMCETDSYVNKIQDSIEYLKHSKKQEPFRVEPVWVSF